MEVNLRFSAVAIRFVLVLPTQRFIPDLLKILKASDSKVKIAAAVFFSLAFSHSSFASALNAGSVQSAPAGFYCVATCSGDFDETASINLTASPSPGYFFAGWGGACSGTGACIVSMTSAQFVSAKFLPIVSSRQRTQNNNPVRTGLFYEDRADFSADTTLTLQFSQSPTDKYLNITRVSCRVLIEGLVQRITRAVLVAGTQSGASDTGRTQYLAFPTYAQVSKSDNNERAYGLDNPVYFKIGPGRYPSLILDAPIFADGIQPTLKADCSIVGDLTDN